MKMHIHALILYINSDILSTSKNFKQHFLLYIIMSLLFLFILHFMKKYPTYLISFSTYGISLILPSENRSSLSQISSAAFLWVMIRTVFSVISRRFDNTFFYVSSSNALVDSSSTRIGRFAYMARAMAILCI